MNLTKWKRIPLFAYLAFVVTCLIMLILLNLAKNGKISGELIAADTVMQYMPGSIFRVMEFVFNLGGTITLFFVFLLVSAATFWNIVFNFINSKEENYLIVSSNLMNFALTVLFIVFGISMFFTKAFLWAIYSILVAFIMTFSMLFQFYGCEYKKEMKRRKRARRKAKAQRNSYNQRENR